MKHFNRLFHTPRRFLYITGTSLEMWRGIKKIIFLLIIILIFSGSAYAGKCYRASKLRWRLSGYDNITASTSIWKCKFNIEDKNYNLSVLWIQVNFDLSESPEDIMLPRQWYFVEQKAKKAAKSLTKRYKVNYIFEENSCYPIAYCR